MILKRFSEIKLKSSGVDGRPLTWKNKKEPDIEESKRKVITSPNSVEETEEEYMEDQDDYVYNPRTGQFEEVEDDID